MDDRLPAGGEVTVARWLRSYRGGRRRGHAPALLFMYQYVNGLLPCGSVLDCGARRTARLGGEEDSILLPGLPISLL